MEQHFEELIDLDQELARNPDGQIFELICTENVKAQLPQLIYQIKIQRRRQEAVLRKHIHSKVGANGEFEADPDFYELAMDFAKWVVGCDRIKNFTPDKLQKWFEMKPTQANRFGAALLIKWNEIGDKLAEYSEKIEKN